MFRQAEWVLRGQDSMQRRAGPKVDASQVAAAWGFRSLDSLDAGVSTQVRICFSRRAGAIQVYARDAHRAPRPEAREYPPPRCGGLGRPNG